MGHTVPVEFQCKYILRPPEQVSVGYYCDLYYFWCTHFYFLRLFLSRLFAEMLRSVFLNGKSSQCIERDVTLLFILLGCTPSICMVQYSKVSIQNCKTLFLWSEEAATLCSSKLFFTLRTFAKDTHRESSARFTAARCVVKWSPRTYTQWDQIAKIHQKLRYKKVVKLTDHCASVWQILNMKWIRWPETEIMWICWNLFGKLREIT